MASRAGPRRPTRSTPRRSGVSRPSDALAARQAADDAFTALLLGLGAVALLVGGVGVANTMVISVLERRAEIGLRRALGATRGHIAAPVPGRVAAAGRWAAARRAWSSASRSPAQARYRGWPVLVPPGAAGLGLARRLVIGAVAGLYPALRAARLATEALRSP